MAQDASLPATAAETPSPSLSAEDIATTMKAMVAAILHQRPSTRDVADKMPIAIIDGEQVFGGEAAGRILVQALVAKPEAWAEWLADPANQKPAMSMVVVLRNELLDTLAASGRAKPVIDVLKLVRDDVDGTRVFASRNARQTDTGQHPIIDIRDRQAVVDNQGANA